MAAVPTVGKRIILFTIAASKLGRPYVIVPIMGMPYAKETYKF